MALPLPSSALMWHSGSLAQFLRPGRHLPLAAMPMDVEGKGQVSQHASEITTTLLAANGPNQQFHVLHPTHTPDWHPLLTPPLPRWMTCASTPAALCIWRPLAVQATTTSPDVALGNSGWAAGQPAASAAAPRSTALHSSDSGQGHIQIRDAGGCDDCFLALYQSMQPPKAALPQPPQALTPAPLPKTAPTAVHTAFGLAVAPLPVLLPAHPHRWLLLAPLRPPPPHTAAEPLSAGRRQPPRRSCRGLRARNGEER